MSKKIVVFLSTFENKRQAEDFANECIDQGLAACINILPPIKSIYIWKKKKVSSKEILVLGKTTLSGFKKLKANIKRLHLYNVPELIALDVKSGHKPYLQWVINSVR